MEEEVVILDEGLYPCEDAYIEYDKYDKLPKYEKFYSRKGE